MAASKINWFEVLFWVILIVLIIMILTRIFGESATDIQIYITIVMGMITMMGYIVKMNIDLIKKKLKI